MVKVIALIKKHPSLSPEEFHRRWLEDHPAYVRRLPGLRRYTQNHAVAHKRTWPYDGAAELWFSSIADVAEAFDGPEGQAVHEHEAHFIGELVWFLADEHEIGVSSDSFSGPADRSTDSSADRSIDRAEETV